jgi:DNA ligase-1
MNAFTALYGRLDETTRTSAKVDALVDYLRAAPAADAAWAVYLLSGQLPRRVVSGTQLSAWAIAEADLPAWLFQESYDAVGDLAETISLALPETFHSDDQPLHAWIEQRLLPLQTATPEARQTAVLAGWRALGRRQRFLWNKLLTGAFRVGVSRKLVTRALARVAGLEEGVIAHRLMGAWDPSAASYADLLSPDGKQADASRPYPFFLAHPLEGDPADVLGDRQAWQIEWKWDGIRAQLIRRGGQTFLWTRGEELVTDRYPEVAALAEHLREGTVIDGELLPWRDGGVMPFAELQRRIGRKTVSKGLLRDVPVVLLSYDLLESDGVDIRAHPLAQRRQQLEALVAAVGQPTLALSEVVTGADWSALAGRRAESRGRGVEGFMVKRLSAPYRVGRVRGDWWKWKIDPFTVDAVLVYAQRGSGKRASLFTDYTFAVWDEDGQLVPFAKAYSGLTDGEIREVDRFVRRHTAEKFGPVRSVTPELVFEIAFENIQRSARHKSGLAVRFPRIVRWRRDKRPVDADRLADIRAMTGADEGPDG